MNVDFYNYGGLGYAVDPESDTKVVTVILIGKQTVKANPRPAVIYVTGGKITEECDQIEALKAYAEANKTMIICPEAADAEELAETYEYVTKKAKTLNIKGGEIIIMGDAENVAAAQELVDYAVDELDADLEDAEEFQI